MTKRKISVTGKRSFYTYAHLRGMTYNAYETAEARQSGRNLHCMSAVVFCAFTIETYLNYIGVLRMRDWDLLERSRQWACKRDQAGTLRCLDFVRIPFTYVAPSATSAKSSGAESFRKLFSATSNVFQITAVALATFL